MDSTCLFKVLFSSPVDVLECEQSQPFTELVCTSRRCGEDNGSQALIFLNAPYISEAC